MGNVKEVNLMLRENPYLIYDFDHVTFWGKNILRIVKLPYI
jgi:hypothetical protein